MHVLGCSHTSSLTLLKCPDPVSLIRDGSPFRVTKVSEVTGKSGCPVFWNRYCTVVCLMRWDRCICFESRTVVLAIPLTSSALLVECGRILLRQFCFFILCNVNNYPTTANVTQTLDLNTLGLPGNSRKKAQKLRSHWLAVVVFSGL